MMAGKHDAVQPVQHAAMTGEDMAEILDPAMALDHAGKQVAHLPGNAAEQAAQHISPDGRKARKIRKAQRKDPSCDHRAQNAAHQPARGSGYGFVGADMRAQLGAADSAAHKVGKGIAAHGDGEHQHQQKRLKAARIGIQNAKQTPCPAAPPSAWEARSCRYPPGPGSSRRITTSSTAKDRSARMGMITSEE